MKAVGDVVDATFNQTRDYVLYGGERFRATVLEDNAGGMHLFILDDDHVVYALDYEGGVSGTVGMTGYTAAETAAMDWVGLLVQGCDPKSDGWDCGYGTAEEAQLGYYMLINSVETCCIADTVDVMQENPFGLCFGGGYAARAFLLAVTEGAPEYAEERCELLGD